MMGRDKFSDKQGINKDKQRMPSDKSGAGTGSQKGGFNKNQQR